ncbi:MAG: ribonuclease R [Desulfofustis sp.]|nr:ribonuclease R [Desulfofustis sp.]
MARQQKNKHSSRGRTRSKNGRLSVLGRHILFSLFEAQEPLGRKDLLKQSQQQGYSSSEINDEITNVLSRGLAESKGKSRLTLNRAATYYTGFLEMKPAGFGFATDLRPVGKKREKLEDPYISRSGLLSARHGDKILILVNTKNHRRNPEGEVLGIIERGSQNLAGFYYQEGSRLVVYPEDPRFPFHVVLDSLPHSDTKLDDGDAVIVSLESDSSSPSQVHGQIAEVLGNPHRLEVQIRMIVEKYGLPTTFSPEALREAKQVEANPGTASREDLRDVLHYTIDGEDAKDFDDAVGVVQLSNGYRLYVSIADVAAYVKPGSFLDAEAYERGTSIYFPNAVLPMLPEELSNNLCSLIPEKDRLTVTAVLDFDRQGVVLGKRFCRSIIRSSKRFTYKTIKKIIVDRDEEIRRHFKPYLTPLKWATKLAEAPQRQRMKRGSVALTITEAEIQLDENGSVATIEAKQRSFANQLIEEFMLAANMAVAETFAERGNELLYRIHEKPDPDKVKEFGSIAQAFGLEPEGAEPTPQWYNSLVTQVAGTPKEFILNSLLLRTLQQARYSPDNAGHFGLGAPNYTHFTSPIRRYADLIVHRLLAAFLLAEDKSSKKLPPVRGRSLKEAGLYLSERERNGISAEREMAERLKCRFMEPRVGERFKAIISFISDTIFFVDLIDQFVSGVVHLSSLTDDYYLHDWKRHRLVGDITGKVLQIGDIIEVELTEVDVLSQKIYFAPTS